MLKLTDAGRDGNRDLATSDQHHIANVGIQCDCMPRYRHILAVSLFTFSLA